MSADAIEREVQRRLVDALAAAGVPQGRISLEVLYMLPPEFVRSYVKLHDRALLESVQGMRGSDGKAKRSVDDRAREPFGGSGGSGKRYRTHWVIRDEAAFEAKRRLDRRLVRLMREAEQELQSLRREAEGAEGAEGP